jgi:membrane associated rhomboid family serine protease
MKGPWDDPPDEDAPRGGSDGESRQVGAAPDNRPGGLLAAALVVAFVSGPAIGGASRWGLSALALAQGRFDTLFAHMFAHAGVAHIAMNLSALLALSPPFVARLAPGPRRLAVYFGFFLLSGLSGAILYLALHPTGFVPMVGASGAICGFWGAVARLGPDGAVRPVFSREVLEVVRAFAISNAILFAIIFVLVRMAGGTGGLAWEAHLGGFLFGMFAVPRFVRRASP